MHTCLDSVPAQDRFKERQKILSRYFDFLSIKLQFHVCIYFLIYDWITIVYIIMWCSNFRSKELISSSSSSSVTRFVVTFLYNFKVYGSAYVYITVSEVLKFGGTLGERMCSVFHSMDYEMTNWTRLRIWNIRLLEQQNLFGYYDVKCWQFFRWFLYGAHDRASNSQLMHACPYMYLNLGG